MPLPERELVSVHLLTDAGAASEDESQAGVAALTAQGISPPRAAGRPSTNDPCSRRGGRAPAADYTDTALSNELTREKIGDLVQQIVEIKRLCHKPLRTDLVGAERRAW